MKRILLFGAGVGLAVVAVALLGLGPDRYQYEEFWFELRSSRIVALGMMALGTGAALGAAFCLARAFKPSSDQAGRRWLGPGFYGAVIFLQASMGPFGVAQHGFDNAEMFATLPPGQASPGLVKSIKGGVWIALAFGILYIAVAAGWFFGARRWPMGRRINGTGIAVAGAGLLLCALGILGWVGNGLTMEAASVDVSRVCNLVILGGILVAATGAILAVVGRRPDLLRQSAATISHPPAGGPG